MSEIISSPEIVISPGDMYTVHYGRNPIGIYNAAFVGMALVNDKLSARVLVFLKKWEDGTSRYLGVKPQASIRTSDKLGDVVMSFIFSSQFEGVSLDAMQDVMDGSVVELSMST